jgi:hypothetical protein
MAFHTFSLWDMAIALDHAEMALFAGHPSCDILPMIETPAFDLNIPFRFDMARSTPADRTRDTLFFSSRTRLVIMADETVDFMNGEVSSLNELSMAGSTSKFHPPS